MNALVSVKSILTISQPSSPSELKYFSTCSGSTPLKKPLFSRSAAVKNLYSHFVILDIRDFIGGWMRICNCSVSTPRNNGIEAEQKKCSINLVADKKGVYVATPTECLAPFSIRVKHVHPRDVVRVDLCATARINSSLPVGKGYFRFAGNNEERLSSQSGLHNGWFMRPP